jgi:hypothetical protein
MRWVLPDLLIGAMGDFGLGFLASLRRIYASTSTNCPRDSFNVPPLKCSMTW